VHDIVSDQNHKTVSYKQYKLLLGTKIIQSFKLTKQFTYVNLPKKIIQSDEDQANTKRDHANDPLEMPIRPNTRVRANKH
jgi:hypothetical protein